MDEVCKVFVYVCLFFAVSQFAYISRKPPKFSVHITHGVGSSDGSAILYILPFLWMTSWARMKENLYDVSSSSHGASTSQTLFG